MKENTLEKSKSGFRKENNHPRSPMYGENNNRKVSPTEQKNICRFQRSRENLRHNVQKENVGNIRTGIVEKTN